MTDDLMAAKCFVPMNEIHHIACQPDSWQCRQLPTDERARLNEGTESFLECELLPKLQNRSFNPMAYHLAKIDWNVFGTLTFEDDGLARNTDEAEKLRQSKFFNLLRSVCIKHGLRTKHLVYYGKTEWGANRRGHFNFLVGKRGTEQVNPETLAAFMQEHWTTGSFRNGTAKIEPFNEHWHLEGVLYQAKYEHDDRGEQLPITEIISPMLLKLFQKNATHVLN